MPISFKSFYKKDYLEEQPGPYRPDEHQGTDKKAHAFHRSQYDHHMKQKQEGRHKNFKQLAKGIIYKSNGGSFVGQRNGNPKKEYFESMKQAEHWVNGTMPKQGGISFLSRNKSLHGDQNTQSYNHEKEIPSKFTHDDSEKAKKAIAKSDSKPKKVEKPKPEKIEKPPEQTGSKMDASKVEVDTDSRTDDATKVGAHPTKSADVKARNAHRAKAKSNVDTKAFEAPIGNGDTTEEYLSKNADLRCEGPPPPIYKVPKELFGGKVADRHLHAIERLMNCEANGAKAGKWSTWSNVPGGAGKIFAQAGELMSLALTSMDDKQAKQFVDTMLEHNESLRNEHPDLYKPIKGKIARNKIIDDSWIKAADGNRTAIHNYLKKEYPGSEIEQGAWDTEQEYNGLGWDNYDDNKGFSTDVYFRVKGKSGSFLHEVSLKKSTLVNFLNSGTGKFDEWDPELPDTVRASVYQKEQRNRLVDHVTKNIDRINPNKPPLSSLMTTKKVGDLNELITTKKSNGDWALNRDKSKVLLTAINQLAKGGDQESIDFIEEHKEYGKVYRANAIQAIMENPKLTQGMMNDIREEFPLKGVAEREEVMAIGEHSLDPHTLKHIFGTDDYEKISEHFEPMTDEKGEPFIGYHVKGSDEVIPVAGIGIREDGVGYGGQFKFEMTLHKGFAEHLKNANQAIYKNKNEEYKSIAHSIHEIFQNPSN